MNISLSKLSERQKKSKPSLSMGLNTRNSNSNNIDVVSAAPKTSVFDGDESDTEDITMSGREFVNSSIAKEQAVLRARAAAAASTIPGIESIYDYDGAYDSFHHPTNQNKIQSGQTTESKASRYIGDLKKAAEERKIERDIAYERKVAREIAAEDELEPDHRGKERFITSSYKRKLEERKVWQEQESTRQRKEEQEDLRNQSEGLGVSGFWGRLTRDVTTSGPEHTSQEQYIRNSQKHEDEFAQVLVEKSDDVSQNIDNRSLILGANDDTSVRKRESLPTNSDISLPVSATSEDATHQRQHVRLLREAKVKEARNRYFKRHGILSS